MYKENLALDYLQCLMCNKPQPNLNWSSPIRSTFLEYLQMMGPDKNKMSTPINP